jgi:hypothetical protein
MRIWPHVRSGKDSVPLIPGLIVIVNVPSSDACSFTIRFGNAVRMLKPSELTTAAGGSTNVMRLPVLLSDMAKKRARRSAGARMNTSRGLLN